MVKQDKFGKKLEELATFKANDRNKEGENLCDFSMLLAAMYADDCDILITCSQHPTDPSLLAQTYLRDDDGKRYMTFFTSIARAKKTPRDLLWKEVSCKYFLTIFLKEKKLLDLFSILLMKMLKMS